MKKVIPSESAMHDFAATIANSFGGGETLCLIGDLGSGKTTFTKGLAVALGIDPDGVTSPTFVVMKIYPVAGHDVIKHLVHIDAYRFTSGQELLDIGAQDYIGRPDCITVIEWADRVRDVWPPQSQQIVFETVSPSRRRVTQI